MNRSTLLSLALAVAGCLVSGPSAHAQDSAAHGQRNFQRQFGQRVELRQNAGTQRRPQLDQRAQGWRQPLGQARGQAGFQGRHLGLGRSAGLGFGRSAGLGRSQAFSGRGFAGPERGFDRDSARRWMNRRGVARRAPFQSGFGQSGFPQRGFGQRGGFTGGAGSDLGVRGPHPNAGHESRQGLGSRGWRGEGAEAEPGGDNEAGKKRKGGKGKRRRGPGHKQGARGGGEPPVKKNP